MKKVITAVIVNPEAMEHASEEWTKLLFEFYLQDKEAETKTKKLRVAKED